MVELAWLLFADSHVADLFATARTTPSRSRATTASPTGSCRGSAASGSCCRCSRLPCSCAAGDARLLPSGAQARPCCGRAARCSRRWRSRSATTSSITRLGRGRRGRGRSCSRRSRSPSWPRCCSGGSRAARVAGLVVELGEGATSVDLREALGRALGDPSLELAYWVPAERSLRRLGDGSPVQLPRPGGERAADGRRARRRADRGADPRPRARARTRSSSQSVCAAAALDARERAPAGRAARAAGRAAGLARAAGRGDGDGAAADRARPARRHAAAARLDRDDARPGRVEARGRPTGGASPFCARRAMRSRSRSRSCAS